MCKTSYPAYHSLKENETFTIRKSFPSPFRGRPGGGARSRGSLRRYKDSLIVRPGGGYSHLVKIEKMKLFP
jgi:hypothetical protein